MKRPVGQHALLRIAGAPIVIAIHTAADVLVGPWLIRVVGGSVEPGLQVVSDDPLHAGASLIIGSSVVVYALLHVLFVSLASMLRNAHDVRERERQLAAARTEAARAQLALLRGQINPHFMFNTLNAIGSLVATGRNDDAEDMIERLSGFLRTSLDRDAEPFSTLDEELAAIDGYLSIESVRFGARLVVDFDIDNGLGALVVPGVLLQPLVENAVKHGVGGSSTPVEIGIRARRDGETLEITVRDRRQGPREDSQPAPGTGTGLHNLRERLRLLYGDAAALRTRVHDDGFEAVVTLPARTHAEVAA
jgi:LytS/YehU family sensor histidine kinase